jgi:RNA polymerase sigma-70 factor (ECF subfamily)
MLSFYLSMVNDDNEREKVENIYNEYRQLMYKKAFSILKNEHDAQDVVHEAFIKIIGCLHSIDCVYDNRTKHLVMIIAENIALDKTRKNKREIFNIDDFAEVLPNSKPSNLDNADIIAIKTALEKLSEHYYHILCLVDYIGFSIKEAAGLLGINESAAGKRLHRARAKMAEYLRDEGLCHV